MSKAKGIAPGSSLGAKEFNSFKAQIILNEVTPRVLQNILKWGCRKPSKMSLKDYLMDEKGLSKLTLKKFFHKTQIAKMDQDPEGHTFDVSLLYGCIQRACDNVADPNDPTWTEPSDTLEYNLYYFKVLRNNFAHNSLMNYSDEELTAFANEIKEKIDTVVKHAGMRYNIPSTETEKLILESNESIDNIISKFDVKNDIFQITEQLKNARIESLSLMRTEGKLELQCVLSRSSSIDMCNVVSGFQVPIKVSDIFTNVDLVTVQENEEMSTELSIENLLKVPSSLKGASPSIILVEGVAGSGKTTLIKWILSDWVNGGGLIQKLQTYELLLYVECRNTAITDFKSLLQCLMPKISRKMSDEDLIQSVLSLKVLILVDGFDEANESSLKLLKELFLKLANRNLQIIITTRPEKVEFLYTMTSTCQGSASLEAYHTKISGVSPERRSELILKLGKVMERNGQSQKDATELSTFVTTTPWLLNFLSLPLNLVLLTFLWVQSPESVKCVKTVTSLYTEIMKLIKKRLLSRLLGDQFTRRLSRSELEERLQRYLEIMYRQSLIGLRDNNVLLSKESMVQLEEMCLQLELPTDELFSSFFSVSGSWNDGKYSKKITFPHPGLHDLYAALGVVDCLKRSDIKKVVKSVNNDLAVILTANKVPAGLTSDITKSVKNLIRKGLTKNITVIGILTDLHQGNQPPFQLVKYRNVLLHVTCLLKSESKLLENYASELVQLLKDTKLEDSEQWLNIVTETDCNINIVSEVRRALPSHHFSIRDSHLSAACHLLQDLEVKSINVHISSDPDKLPDLRKTLDVVATKKSQIKLSLQHHWQYPELGCSDGFLASLESTSNHRVKLMHFTGSVKALSSLSKTLETLYVALGSSYANNVDRTPDYIFRVMQNLENLYIHIVGGIAVECLPLLPSRRSPVDLWFSDIDDTNVEWVEKAMQKLADRIRPFWSIRFPRSKLTVNGCLKLAQHLKKVMIGKDGVLVSSVNLSKKDVETLTTVYLMEINTSFHLSNEIEIWNFQPTH